MMDRRALLRQLGALLIGLAVPAVPAVAQKEKDAGKPKKKGTVVGKLTARGDRWIEVKADGEEKPRRYVPHWRGGAPNAGGGPDKKMLAKFKTLKVGSRVRLEWVFEERPRVEKIEVLKAPTGKGKEEKK